MKKFSLLLVSSFGVGLKTWKKNGLYGREIGYYKKLGRFLNNFAILSYDKKKEIPEGEKYEYFYNKACLPDIIFSFFFVLLYFKNIKKYEIIKTNQLAGAWSAAIIKLFFRKKIFVLRGGHAWDYEGGNLITRKISDILLKWSFLSADVIFLVSNEDKNKYVTKFGKKIGEKIKILPNSIDLNIFSYKERVRRNSINILLVGRLVEMKNFQSVVEAITLLGLSLREKINLGIIGDGPYRGNLEEMSRINGVNTTFYGPIPNNDIVDYLQKSDIYILPQVYGSGMSKGIIEAMATGNIVIASDLPAHRNTIDENENGFICQTDPKSIMEKIEYIIQNFNSDKLKLVRENAIKKVRDNFSMDSVSEKEYGFLLEVYNKKNV